MHKSDSVKVLSTVSFQNPNSINLGCTPPVFNETNCSIKARYVPGKRFIIFLFGVNLLRKLETIHDAMYYEKDFPGIDEIVSHLFSWSNYDFRKRCEDKYALEYLLVPRIPSECLEGEKASNDIKQVQKLLTVILEPYIQKKKLTNAMDILQDHLDYELAYETLTEELKQHWSIFYSVSKSLVFAMSFSLRVPKSFLSGALDDEVHYGVKTRYVKKNSNMCTRAAHQAYEKKIAACDEKVNSLKRKIRNEQIVHRNILLAYGLQKRRYKVAIERWETMYDKEYDNQLNNNFELKYLIKNMQDMRLTYEAQIIKFKEHITLMRIAEEEENIRQINHLKQLHEEEEEERRRIKAENIKKKIAAQNALQDRIRNRSPQSFKKIQMHMTDEEKVPQEIKSRRSTRKSVVIKVDERKSEESMTDETKSDVGKSQEILLDSTGPSEINLSATRDSKLSTTASSETNPNIEESNANNLQLDGQHSDTTNLNREGLHASKQRRKSTARKSIEGKAARKSITNRKSEQSQEMNLLKESDEDQINVEKAPDTNIDDLNFQEQPKLEKENVKRKSSLLKLGKSRKSHDRSMTPEKSIVDKTSTSIASDILMESNEDDINVEKAPDTGIDDINFQEQPKLEEENVKRKSSLLKLGKSRKSHDRSMTSEKSMVGNKSVLATSDNRRESNVDEIRKSSLVTSDILMESNGDEIRKSSLVTSDILMESNGDERNVEKAPDTSIGDLNLKEQPKLEEENVKRKSSLHKLGKLRKSHDRSMTSEKSMVGRKSTSITLDIITESNEEDIKKSTAIRSDILMESNEDEIRKSSLVTSDILMESNEDERNVEKALGTSIDDLNFQEQPKLEKDNVKRKSSLLKFGKSRKSNDRSMTSEKSMVGRKSTSDILTESNKDEINEEKSQDTSIDVFKFEEEPKLEKEKVKRKSSLGKSRKSHDRSMTSEKSMVGRKSTSITLDNITESNEEDIKESTAITSHILMKSNEDERNVEKAPDTSIDDLNFQEQPKLEKDNVKRKSSLLKLGKSRKSHDRSMTSEKSIVGNNSMLVTSDNPIESNQDEIKKSSLVTSDIVMESNEYEINVEKGPDTSKDDLNLKEQPKLEKENVKSKSASLHKLEKSRKSHDRSMTSEKSIVNTKSTLITSETEISKYTSPKQSQALMKETDNQDILKKNSESPDIEDKDLEILDKY